MLACCRTARAAQKTANLAANLNVIFKAVHRIDAADKENVADISGTPQGFIPSLKSPFLGLKNILTDWTPPIRISTFIRSIFPARCAYLDEYYSIRHRG